YCTVISMASNDHTVWRSHGQEAKIGCPDGQHIPWHGEAIRSFLLPCAPPGVPDRERGPERCHSSGAAVDVWASIMASATPFSFCTTQKHLAVKRSKTSMA